MTPERWQEVTRLYQAALQVNPAERAAFLARSCGADDGLRREVESLLRADDAAGSFLAAGALNDAAMALVTGKTSSV